MAMDFFEHQALARRRTALLVALFVLAVASIIALTWLAVLLILFQQGAGASASNPWLGLAVAAAVIFVVGSGSAWKVAELSSGGAVVAEMLGGRVLPGEASDPAERRLLDVVEEMAIAAGMPAPAVYVLDSERGINAFAAGWSASDAVIAVTRGALDQLDRDELQGVVAHETSHVLNGDMRLNMRLMGVLHGILVIGLVGWSILRHGHWAGGSRRRGGGGTGAAVVMAGLALVVIGSAGTFFGDLIKAAVSRQRELLADASAVQFTRNPLGLGRALRRILGRKGGSRLVSPRVREVGHLLFAPGFRTWLGSLQSTHPPLAERIRRIAPDLLREPVPPSAAGRVAAPEPARRRTAPGEGVPQFAAASGAAAAPGQAGAPVPAHVERARELLASMPARLIAAARQPFAARTVIYRLLLSEEPEVRARQEAALAAGGEPAALELTRALASLQPGIDPAAVLPLVDLALPSLRALSPEQYGAFRSRVRELVEADQRVDLHEWVLGHVVLHHLDRHFGLVSPALSANLSIAAARGEASVLLSALARAGADPDRAWSAGRKALGLEGAMLPAERCGLGELDRALDTLARLEPRSKKALLAACAAAVAADRAVEPAEAALFRAVADAMDCPVPPLLPGQRLG